MAKTLKTRPSMPDSVAPSPGGRKIHLIETIRALPAWTAYSIVCAKSTSPPISQPIIPTENVGSLNRPASQNTKNREKGLQSDDNEEPRPPNTGGHKKSPQVKTMNMIYATHIPKRERKRALRYIYEMAPVAPKYNPWPSCSITFD